MYKPLINLSLKDEKLFFFVKIKESRSRLIMHTIEGDVAMM